MACRIERVDDGQNFVVFRVTSRVLVSSAEAGASDLGSKSCLVTAYTPHEALRHWPREGGSRATDVRVSRQSDLVRADDGTPVPYPLLWPCAAISCGCFAPGGFALSHERCVRRFTTAGQSRRARRAIYRKFLRRACQLASRPLSVDRPDDLIRRHAQPSNWCPRPKRLK